VVLVYFAEVMVVCSQSSYSIAMCILIPDLLSFFCLICIVLKHLLVLFLVFFKLVGKKKYLTEGVFINCSNGWRVHINCVAKTKVCEVKKLMSRMLKVDQIEIRGVFFVHFCAHYFIFRA
jgi:hypothetical protein